MAGIHAIERYHGRYGSSILTTNWGGFVFRHVGYIMCSTSATSDRMVITIAPDDEPLHAGKTVTTVADTGFIAIRRADLAAFVDLLRNEGPVYMEIKSAPLDVFNRIFTGEEPVGEGESTV
jgi:hypothetical protein